MAADFRSCFAVQRYLNLTFSDLRVKGGEFFAAQVKTYIQFQSRAVFGKLSYISMVFTFYAYI